MGALAVHVRAGLIWLKENAGIRRTEETVDGRLEPVLSLSPISGSYSGPPILVSNNSGGDFAAGEVLALNGYDTMNVCPYVRQAIASDDTRRGVFIADEAIVDGVTGNAVPYKYVTADTQTLSAGRPLFLHGSTAGAVTRTDPQIANLAYNSQEIGHVLTVDAAGVVLLYPGFGDRKSADLRDSRILALGTTRKMGGRDVGRAGSKGFYLTGVAADGETVTLGTRIYEFDTNASVLPGSIAVDITADQTADASITALVAAVNAHTGRVAELVPWTSNDDTSAGCHIVEKSLTGTDIAVSKVCANGVVLAATTTGAAPTANRDLFAFKRTITAADVLALARAAGGGAVIGEIDICGVPVTSEPSVFTISMYNSSGDKLLDNTMRFDWVQANTNFWILKCRDPNAVLANTDTVHVIAIS